MTAPRKDGEWHGNGDWTESRWDASTGEWVSRRRETTTPDQDSIQWSQRCSAMTAENLSLRTERDALRAQVAEEKRRHGETTALAADNCARVESLRATIEELAGTLRNALVFLDNLKGITRRIHENGLTSIGHIAEYHAEAARAALTKVQS